MLENVNELSKLIDNDEKEDKIPRTRAQKVVMKWEKLKLLDCSSSRRRKILKSVSGYSNPQEILAVIGPRGSGKTSLLKSISNKLNYSKYKFDLQGDIYLNSHNLISVNSFYFIKYLHKSHTFLDFLTPHEYFEFNLSLKSHLTYSEVSSRVSRVCEELKLKYLESKSFGNNNKLGDLSLAERRKVYIAGEIMLYPSILIIDEALSGLDTISSKSILTLLKDSLTYGINLIISIQEISYENFLMLDRLIIMQEGWFVYQGKASDSINYFNSIGFTLQKQVSPAEHFIKILTVEDSEHYTLNESKTVFMLKEKYEKTGSGIWKDADLVIYLNGLKYSQDWKKSWIKRVRVLVWRHWIGYKRNFLGRVSKVTQVLALVIIANLVFFDLGYDSEGIENRKGLIVILMCVFFLVPCFLNCAALEYERRVLKREIKERKFGAFTYLTSRVLVEFPLMFIMILVLLFSVYFSSKLNHESIEKVFVLSLIVLVIYLQGTILGLLAGSLGSNPNTTFLILTILSSFCILFSGFFTDPESGLKISYIMKFLSPLYFLRDAALKNEFEDLDYNSDVNPEPQDIYNYKREIWQNILISLIHFIFIFMISYIVLNKKL